MEEFLRIWQPVTHYALHFLAPGLIAWLFFRDQWKRAWLIMLVTMIVDLDHLFAVPVFDPDRCSIGFHWLHTYPAIGVYFLVWFYRPLRIVATGLLFHMLTDYRDCLYSWYLN